MTRITAARVNQSYFDHDLEIRRLLSVKELIMTNVMEKSSQPFEFWSMSYRGHDMAVQRHNSGWIVYINKVMQHGMRFDDARSAANWLRRNVDLQAAS